LNIYLIDEDYSEAFCLKANNMSGAIKVAEKLYLKDRKERLKKQYSCSLEKKRYYGRYLKSCTFIGKLKN
jgi:hypothetical protein